MAVCTAALAGILVRPRRSPEWIWAVGGAIALIASGLLPLSSAARAIARGTDVYLFLAGMMLLAETARHQGVFDWLAAVAVRGAGGSPRRLFAIVYGLGVAVTAVLSNDATAVVLTPAVAAVTRRARVEPLPHVFACAMVANAASFILPISNPANLVIFGGGLPPLASWVRSFALPSVAAVAATFAALALVERRGLTGTIDGEIGDEALRTGGRVALWGIGLTAAILAFASAAGMSLGLPTALAAGVVLAVVALRDRAVLSAAGGASWTILLLVAGLFVLVDGVERSGLLEIVRSAAAGLAHDPLLGAAMTGAFAVAAAANLANNLPVAVLAGQAVGSLHDTPAFVSAVAIGVDLGPNLSVTGSLATVLWLVALRRDGISVSPGRFFRTGILVMPPALAVAILTLVAATRR